MRRFIALFIIAVLSLSLCACGSAAEPEPTATPVPTPEEYGQIITKLDAEDYDGAIEIIEGMKPAPEAFTVELTQDNLLDYFEIVDEDNYQYEADGTPKYLASYRYINLKPEYVAVNEQDWTAKVGYTYHLSFLMNISSMDIAAKEYTGGQEMAKEDMSSLMQLSSSACTECYEQWNKNDMNIMFNDIDFNIVSAEGNITIANAA